MRPSSLRCLAFLFLLISFVAVPESRSQTVYVIPVDASINPATADFIKESIDRANSAGASCLVIELNTPGGYLNSTRTIVSAILTAQIPVVVYVSPAGGRAASAGTFITLAAHVAAMAPGTNIGAAHPVDSQGQTPDSVMNTKATNDAAAFIRTISEKRHRNVRWAEDAVRNSVSITETEALHDSVIDLVAQDVRHLLEEIDGRIVAVGTSHDTLRTRNASVVRRTMGWRLQLLDLLTDPNIAYIFFMLGLAGLGMELYNPGAILPGVVGAIAMILALYAFQTLPINYAALGLILLGIIMFLLEIKVTSYGILSIGGVVALALGSVMLIDPESPLEVVSLSWAVILPVIACATLFFVFVVGMGIRAQRRKTVTGVEGLIGETGTALSNLTPEGQVRVHGEIWNATSASGTIKKGTTVSVQAVANLRLTVISHTH